MLSLDKLKQYADILGRGAVLELAPGIAGGMLVELFEDWEVDKAMVTRYVDENLPLWEKLNPYHRDMIKKLSYFGGDLEWLTPDLVIQSIREDYPVVTSLFLGWPEAYTWLERQVDELKKLALE